MTLEIRRLKPEETHGLRHQVLRPNQPPEACIYPGDDDQTTFHLGAYRQGELICIASFYLEPHPSVRAQMAYRLRGMATAPDYRGQGIASEVSSFAINELRLSGCDKLWCNARTSAVPLYDRAGFTKIGDEFEIDPIGPHFLMVRLIQHSSIDR